MNKCLILVLLCIITRCKQLDGYKILGISSSTMKSHHIFFKALMKGLADDGNNVTFISAFQSTNPIVNLEEIQIDLPPEIAKQIESGITKIINVVGMNCFALTNVMYRSSELHVNWTVQSKQFQNFLRRNDHFDVVLVQIMVSEALLSLGHYFNAPVIAVSPSAANKWTRDLVGAPNLASFVPHVLTGYTDRMNFWQRMYNSLCYLYEDVANPLFYAPNQQKLVEHIYRNDNRMPSFDVLRRNVSLVLYNANSALEPPAPAQSNMIGVGGLFIDRKNTTSLPKDLEKFIEQSNGVIYIAFGSNVDFSDFSKNKQEALVNAFSEYPNIRIILKARENVIIPSHKASNVFVRRWFPQQAILAHQKLKMFITHGGLLSTIESIHFAKPIIGIPMYFDQELNMKIAENRGYGISLPYRELTTEKLRIAVQKIIDEPSYMHQVKITSLNYWRQIKPPLETAIYWVKHVAKHKGAPHMRSIAVDMPFYVYYNLDCWLFLIVCCTSAILIIAIFCRKILRAIFVAPSTKKYKLP